jgi:hypothetical protein
VKWWRKHFLGGEMKRHERTRTASEELTDVCIVEEQTEGAERERAREGVYSFIHISYTG